MGRIVLVTGGARSGKSNFAEDLYKNTEDVVYIATAKICDEEMKERVSLHQQSRSQKWSTYEGSEQLYKAVNHSKNYLLDCLTIMSSNIMFELTKEIDRITVSMQGQVEEKVVNEIKALIARVKNVGGNLVMVTNEVGYAIVPETHVARVYRDIIGKVNQRVAALCDEVYLVVCGIPQRIK